MSRTAKVVQVVDVARTVDPNKSKRLTRGQKLFLLSLIADGLNSTQINNATSRYSEPFILSDVTITGYRNKQKTKYKEIAEQTMSPAWTEGFAKSEERVKVLKKLADRLIKDLLHEDPASEKVWLGRLKAFGQGANYTLRQYKEFNFGEMQQLRGLFEDIAKETGGRSGEKPEDPSELAAKILPALPADIIAPSFFSVYRDIKAKAHNEYVFEGGRGSTKSSFVSEVIPMLLINNPTMHALVLRQVKETLRESVYGQLKWAINELGVMEYFKCTTSPLEIEYLPTHQKIYFRGADDPANIKSIKPEFGHIGIVWFEELDQFHGPEAVRNIIQSALRGGEEAYMFKTFNPPRTVQSWVNKYVLIPKKNMLVHKSNYLDVPKEWLGQPWLDEAEHLKEVNPTAYEHEYMGVANGTGGQIFENVLLRKITDEEVAQFDQTGQGIDWGYYPDPFVWSRSHFDAARLTLFIFDEKVLYKNRNRAAYDTLTEENKLSEELIIADSAEPKSVADFREYGATIRGAEKGPESVKYSMKWLAGLTAIVIDDQRAPLHAQEFSGYEFKRDKEGNIISEYPDVNNHSIDATRYRTNLIWRMRGK